MSIKTERITQLKQADMMSLCEATEAAIRDGIGFNWVTPPSREVLEAYWRGVLLVPERLLFAARLHGNLVATIQLVKPSPSKQTMAFAASISNHFVAPWARKHGLAKALLTTAEEEARHLGFTILNLTVRNTQEAAINLYVESGYIRWGEHPAFELINGKLVGGHFFYKQLKDAP
jgi:ribosomal protein S18 acetylase RimI-like enzyme